MSCVAVPYLCRKRIRGAKHRHMLPNSTLRAAYLLFRDLCMLSSFL
jgi:hypothetical protein